MEVVLLSSMSTLHVRIVPCRLPVSSLSHLPGSSSSISMYAAAARPRPFVATRCWLLFALVRVTRSFTLHAVPLLATQVLADEKKRRRYARKIEKKALSNEEKTRGKEAFAKYDVDNSGSMSAKELERVITMELGLQVRCCGMRVLKMTVGLTMHVCAPRVSPAHTCRDFVACGGCCQARRQRRYACTPDGRATRRS